MKISIRLDIVAAALLTAATVAIGNLFVTLSISLVVAAMLTRWDYYARQLQKKTPPLAPRILTILLVWVMGAMAASLIKLSVTLYELGELGPMLVTGALLSVGFVGIGHGLSAYVNRAWSTKPAKATNA